MERKRVDVEKVEKKVPGCSESDNWHSHDGKGCGKWNWRIFGWEVLGLKENGRILLTNYVQCMAI